MWKYVLAWIPMVFIAIINGAIREGWYSKHVSELQAHQVSTATGVLLFGGLHLNAHSPLETCVSRASSDYWFGMAWDDSHLRISLWALRSEAVLA